jgi:hypothetical protein
MAPRVGKHALAPIRSPTKAARPGEAFTEFAASLGLEVNVRVRSTSRAACLILASLTLLASAASYSASAAPVRTPEATVQQPVPNYVPGNPALVNAAVTAARSILHMGTTTLANEYAGVTLTNKSQNIVVYTKAARAATSTKLEAFLPGRTTLVSVPRSYKELQSINDAFTAATDSLVAGGIQPVLWGPDPAQGIEDVQVLNMTDSQQAELTRRFPSQLKLQSIPADQAPKSFSSRIDDSPLWFAGDFIARQSGDNRTCTNGPATRNAAGQYWIITAEHCFSLYDTISNWAPSLTPKIGNPNNIIGIVKARDNRASGLDAELINAEGSDEFWAGKTDSPLGQFWRGAAPTMQGSAVCTEGAFEGEVCRLTVIQTGQSGRICEAEDGNGNCTTYRQITHLSSAENIVGSGPAAGQGDSGGPVIEYSNGIWAIGTITGAGGPQYSCSNWSKQAPNRLCSSTVLFTDIGPVLSLWSLTMIGTG